MPSTKAVSVYSSIIVCECMFLLILAHVGCILFFSFFCLFPCLFLFANLVGKKQLIVLICISLITSEVDHFSYVHRPFLFLLQKGALH